MEHVLKSEVLIAIMFLGTVFFLLLGFPVAFTLSGSALLMAVVAVGLGAFDFSILSALPQRVFSVMTNEVLVAVPLFVFMGVTLERSRVAEELLDNMGRLFGGLRGGLGYSVFVVGALLAASTGIVGATVVTMGLLSLPTMLRRGYDPALACGSIAASGTLGQIIPPSIVLVLLGDQLSVAFQDAQYRMGNFAPDTVSVNDLFAGALFPGLVLVGMYMLYQAAMAWLKPESSPAIPADELRGTGDTSILFETMKSLVAPVVLIIAVLGSILGGLASPTEAAAVGAIGSLMLAGYRLDHAHGRPILLGGTCLLAVLVLTAFVDLRMQRNEISGREWGAILVAILLSVGLGWGLLVSVLRVYKHRVANGNRILQEVMRATMEISSMVFVILVGAAAFSLVFRGLGGDVLIENFLKGLPGGTVAAILVVMAVMFILGFFLDFLEIIFIVVPIVAPILLQMEVAPDVPMSPVWLGVMLAMNLQTSFLTPPFGFALFYLRGVAPDSIKTMDIYRGIVPFVAIQIFALVVLWYLPRVATWLPEALYPR
ncbi:MAG: TRAP transporter large permease subunit [Candidatus Lambdaproteobacteria bacterium]|nr:TRAP transporter large permease subunit [Candidatus Lambdaproteobacteria bacterium]